MNESEERGGLEGDARIAADTVEFRRAHARACEIFDAVRTARPENRAVLLDSQCGSDTRLRAEVESLLRAHDGSPGFLERPPLGRVTPHRPPEFPVLVAGFRIERLLGSGGMGAVYLAVQENPRREVALKFLLPGASRRSSLQRFDREAQVLGRLQHPCIAQIHAAGLAETGIGPQPYFAMELVRGRPIVAAAGELALSLEARVRLLSQIARAVHYAHEHGVAHRDLKPANILLDESGLPRILDFGIARTTDADLSHTASATRTGEILGTLTYMSPEQLEGAVGAIDARSDVYSLGLVAYELLSGRAAYPLDSLALPAIVAALREREPERLGARDPRLRGDLELIVGKATDKDRERRYASALELAEDFDRHLRDEPVLARAPSHVYQLRKFARRNRIVVGGVGATVAALVLGLIVALHQRGLAVAAAASAKAESERASAEERKAQREARVADQVVTQMQRFFEGTSPTQTRVDIRAVDVLDRSAAMFEEPASTSPRCGRA